MAEESQDQGPLPSDSSIARVRRALDAGDVGATIHELPNSTRTAAEAASSIGCTVAQIAKSVVFRLRETDQPLLVVLSGEKRVDTAALSRLVDGSLERAKPEFVRERTGFAIGGVAPVGHIAPIRVIIDRSLAEFPDVWAAAGTPHAVFRLTFAELCRLSGGVVADVSE